MVKEKKKPFIFSVFPIYIKTAGTSVDGYLTDS